MLESLKEDHKLDANMEGFCWASNVLYSWLFTNFIEVEKLDVCVCVQDDFYKSSYK